MRRRLWIIMAVVVTTLIALSFTWPHAFVSPGNLRSAHTALQQDCFACHAPLRGASPARCMSCHKLATIGLRDTKGRPIQSAAKRPPFHQALAETNCMACHRDHPRPLLIRRSAHSFDHSMLKSATRANCQSCHIAPKDALHQMKAAPCATCHQSTGWKPASFNHDRFFKLDGDHNVACTTCHLGGSFKRTTCYGCHEHQQARIVAEHREEGITNITKCVRCHRSADGDVEKENGREGED
jgi:hypothetical protein